jgi:hypothetical protein
MKTQNLKTSPCLENERGLWHELLDLLWIGWICWMVVAFPSAMLYGLLIIIGMAADIQREED